MAGKINWYLQIRNLSKTDERALELYNNLQKAETDDEKNKAKQEAQEYIQSISNDGGENSGNGGESQNTETETTNDTESEDSTRVEESVAGDEECDNQPVSVDTLSVPETPLQGNSEADKENEKALTDLSAPAFAPRLAKCGITREEELFLHGVFVRKMDREEKILMRRSIYNKKTLRNAQIQAEFKKKRIEQKQRDANDVEKQRYHQERKYVNAIVDALNSHCNLGWIFANIEGLTPDIVREFLKKPGYVNAFRQANPKFVENFKKKYGVDI